MELCLTETQLKNLIKNTLKTKELSEQGETVNPEPKSGTSDKQTGASGYPEVGKWESGVTRGPANQIGVTKWSDVVGVNLKRSKANQLKEQEGMTGAMGDMMNTMGKFTPNPEEYNLDNFLAAVKWDDWGQWSLTIGSIGAAFFIPGAQGLGIAAVLDLIGAADQYFRQKDNVGAGVSTALAFIPVFGDVMGIGKLSNKTITNLINKFGPLKTKQQVLKVVKSLPEKSMERYTIEQILKMGPKQTSKLINSLAKTGLRNQSEAKSVVININKLYKEGKLKKEGVKNLFDKLGLQRFAFDIGLSGQIIVVGSLLKDKQEDDKIKNLIKPTKVYTIDDVSDDPYENQ
jgi:hypothetical protein